MSNVIYYRGEPWELSDRYVTSDGFMMASGRKLESDSLEPALDEDGWPIHHEFLLGRAKQAEYAKYWPRQAQLSPIKRSGA